MAKNLSEINKKWAFVRGYSQVPRAKSARLQEKIKDALGVKSRMGWFRHLHGISMHTAQQAEDIEIIFKSIGIIDVWGPEPYKYEEDDENKS